jgi:cytochrome c oxidase subunit 2
MRVVRPLFKAIRTPFALAAACAAIPLPALAAWPEPWQLDLQEAASPIMREIVDLHNALLIICVLIVALVLGLLAYVIVKFNEKAHPQPSKTSHNTVIEVIWTALPVVILVGIAIPSFRLLYNADVLPQPEMTIKAVGHQWYWSYEYPDHGGFGFDSVMVPDNEIKQGQRRLLEVDNRIVLPVDTTIRVITTSVDVIHAWAVPALGLKTDSVPGRLNEMWVKIEKPGTYYGQCSELCGNNHAFMPIQVEAVSKEQFARWIEEAKRKFASSMPAGDERLAAR